MLESLTARLSWWLIEAVPSCDVSNNKRGLRRALVGIGVPLAVGDQQQAGTHVTRLPLLWLDKTEVIIFVSAKVTLSPHRGRLAALKPIGRLRDPVLDEVMIHVAESQSRLGHVSF